MHNVWKFGTVLYLERVLVMNGYRGRFNAPFINIFGFGGEKSNVWTIPNQVIVHRSNMLSLRTVQGFDFGA